MDKLRNQLKLEDEILRRKALKSLLAFTLYTMPGYVVKNFHKSICDTLDKFIEGKTKRLMIFMPPQTGKSELSSRRLPAYTLGRNPDKRIGVFSYSADLAQGFSRSIQRVIESPEYQKVFHATKLPERSDVGFKRTSEIFEIVGNKGFVKCVGVEGSLTGTPLDIAIIDDPHKDLNDARSKTRQGAVWNWYETVLETRLRNNGQIMCLLTRWHTGDLAGRILDRDGLSEDGGLWEVIRFPAIQDKPPSALDPRNPGEPLFPEWHSLEKLQKIQDDNPKMFSSLYQQNPTVDTGLIFQREHFEIVTRIQALKVQNRNVNFFADTAFTSKKSNDPSVVMAVAVYQNSLYVIDILRTFQGFSDLVKSIELFYKKYATKRSVLYIEPKASGQSVTDFLRKRKGLNVVEYKLPSGSKEERAHTITGYTASERVKLCPGKWNRSFMEELITFPDGMHDDRVDCLVMACTQLFLRKKARRRPRRLIVIKNT